eukprot:m.374135 g.374135  ORF g.374135 m.374135 type:complete len:249 (-) comp20004_c2_seq1:79-825(-)
MMFTNARFKTRRQEFVRLLRSEGSVFFDHVVEYDETHVAKLVQNWPKELPHKRGFYYYTWKFYLIDRQLQTMKEGEMLFFLDAGCNISTTPEAVANFREYYVKPFVDDPTLELLAFLVGSGARYTTHAILVHFGVTKEFAGAQIGSGIIVVRNTANVREFFRSLSQLAQTEQHLFSDVHNKDPDNQPEFVDNRHDQAVLSIAVKVAAKANRLNVNFVIPHYHFGPVQGHEEQYRAAPIQAIRATHTGR